MIVKCIAQEHNTMSPARARTQTAQYGVEHANHEANALPTLRLEESYSERNLPTTFSDILGSIREALVASKTIERFRVIYL